MRIERMFVLSRSSLARRRITPGVYDHDAAPVGFLPRLVAARPAVATGGQRFRALLVASHAVPGASPPWPTALAVPGVVADARSAARWVAAPLAHLAHLSRRVRRAGETPCVTSAVPAR